VQCTPEPPIETNQERPRFLHLAEHDDIHDINAIIRAVTLCAIVSKRSNPS
jgi:hypothetical protein